MAVAVATAVEGDEGRWKWGAWMGGTGRGECRGSASARTSPPRSRGGSEHLQLDHLQDLAEDINKNTCSVILPRISIYCTAEDIYCPDSGTRIWGARGSPPLLAPGGGPGGGGGAGQPRGFAGGRSIRARAAAPRQARRWSAGPAPPWSPPAPRSTWARGTATATAAAGRVRGTRATCGRLRGAAAGRLRGRLRCMWLEPK